MQILYLPRVSKFLHVLADIYRTCKCSSEFSANRNTQCESAVTPLSSSFSATSIHPCTHTAMRTHTCTFNTFSLGPPVILCRISVHYAISPNWVGSSDIYCAPKVLFSWGCGGRKDKMRATGNNRALFMCGVPQLSVQLQCCLFYWGETRVKSVLLAWVNACTIGSPICCIPWLTNMQGASIRCQGFWSGLVSKQEVIQAVDRIMFV